MGFQSQRMGPFQMLAKRPLPWLIILPFLLFLLLAWHSYSVHNPTPYFSSNLRSAQSFEDHINNSTLGFEEIFVVSLPSRTDRRDGMVLQAALSDLSFEFVDGVLGSHVPDNAIPTSPNHGRMGDPSIGSWRGHMNAIQEIVKRNLSTALIIEDDADWDIRIKPQLRDFATAVQGLTQPMMGMPPSTYADMTFPTPNEHSPATIPDMNLHFLPATTAPTYSPYGDNWDILWLGHCGMRFPNGERGAHIPKGRVTWEDHTVPQKQHLRSIYEPEDLLEYPHHTRAVHHAQEPICSLAYAVTQQAARQLLYEVGMTDFSSGYDLELQWFCEGLEGRRRHRCLSMQPSLFQHHRPAGPLSAESDISPHGEGWQERAHSDVLRWSVRMNAEELMSGGRNFSDQWPDE